MDIVALLTDAAAHGASDVFIIAGRPLSYKQDGKLLSLIHILLALLKGMEAGVAAMIADLLLDMAASVRKEKNALLTLMMPGAFLACFLFQIDAVLVILACAGICLAYGFLTPHLKKA